MSNLSDSNPLQLILAIDADELRFDKPVIGVNDTLTSVIFKNLSFEMKSYIKKIFIICIYEQEKQPSA